MKKAGASKEFVPIEQLLLPDTPEIKKLKTLRGKEEEYAYILGPLEFVIAAFYIDNPRLTDKDVKKSLLHLKENYTSTLSASTMEGMLQIAASAGLRRVPLTKHEFFLVIGCILDAIDNRSWIPDKRAYLLWIANFFDLLGRDEKKRLEKFYSDIEAEVGLDKNVLLHGGTAKGSLKLNRLGKNSWGFQMPNSWEGVNTIVYDALDRLDSPKEKERQEGAAMLRDSVEICPGHPLALSQYGFFLCQTGRKEEGRRLIKKVVDGGRKLFPKNFAEGKDLLEWGWLENRPFLRCLCWLGMEHFRKDEHAEALEIFKEILAFNPDDNQGVREIAIKCYFALKSPGKVLELCSKYDDDCSPAITYGRALALFQLGRKESGEKALRKAVKYSPLVLQELVQPSEKKPKTAIEGCITAGGRDEAWEYRQIFGEHWLETEGAAEMLEEIKDSRSNGK